MVKGYYGSRDISFLGTLRLVPDWRHFAAVGMLVFVLLKSSHLAIYFWNLGWLNLWRLEFVKLLLQDERVDFFIFHHLGHCHVHEVVSLI